MSPFIAGQAIGVRLVRRCVRVHVAGLGAADAEGGRVIGARGRVREIRDEIRERVLRLIERENWE